MLLGLNQLVDSLTGLERILTTPIPFSYSIHLWSVCWIYCSLLVSALGVDPLIPSHLIHNSLSNLLLGLDSLQFRQPPLQYVVLPSGYLNKLKVLFLLQTFIFFGFLVAGEEIESMFP